MTEEERALQLLEVATENLVAYLEKNNFLDMEDLPPEGQHLYRRWKRAKARHERIVMEQLEPVVVELPWLNSATKTIIAVVVIFAIVNVIAWLI